MTKSQIYQIISSFDYFVLNYFFLTTKYRRSGKIHKSKLVMFFSSGFYEY